MILLHAVWRLVWRSLGAFNVRNVQTDTDKCAQALTTQTTTTTHTHTHTHTTTTAHTQLQHTHNNNNFLKQQQQQQKQANKQQTNKQNKATTTKTCLDRESSAYLLLSDSVLTTEPQTCPLWTAVEFSFGYVLSPFCSCCARSQPSVTNTVNYLQPFHVPYVDTWACRIEQL